MEHSSHTTPPQGYCCKEMYDQLYDLKKKVYTTVWSPKLVQEITRSINTYNEICRHHQEHTNDPLYKELMKLGKDLRYVDEACRPKARKGFFKELAHAWPKKVAVSLTIGFLSVSTIRYWMNVAYPHVQVQGLRKAVAAMTTKKTIDEKVVNATAQKGSDNNAPSVTQVKPFEQLLEERLREGTVVRKN